jgi:hypothetical protein
VQQGSEHQAGLANRVDAGALALDEAAIFNSTPVQIQPLVDDLELFSEIAIADSSHVLQVHARDALI